MKKSYLILAMLLCGFCLTATAQEDKIVTEKLESTSATYEFDMRSLTGSEVLPSGQRKARQAVGPEIAKNYRERITNMPDFISDFIDKYVEAVNGVLDGGKNWLSDPSKGEIINQSYAYRLKDVTKKTNFTFSASDDIPTIREKAEAAAKPYVDAEYDILKSFMPYAFLVINHDHPEAFWIGNRYQFGYMVDYSLQYNMPKGTGTVTAVITSAFYLHSSNFDIRGLGISGYNFTNPDNIAARVETFKTAKQTILAQCPSDGSRHDKLLAAHDWLTMHNCYNNYYSQGYGQSSLGDTPWSSLSALEGITGQAAPVCEGYCRAMKVLCDAMDIPCILLSGLARKTASALLEAHMWLYVEMEDGKWYAIDPTWDDPVISGVNTVVSGSETHTWFLVGSSTDIGGGYTFIESHPELWFHGFDNKGTIAWDVLNGPQLATSAWAPEEEEGILSTADWYGYALKTYGDDKSWEKKFIRFKANTPGDVTPASDDYSAFPFGTYYDGNVYFIDYFTSDFCSARFISEEKTVRLPMVLNKDYGALDCMAFNYTDGMMYGMCYNRLYRFDPYNPDDFEIVAEFPSYHDFYPFAINNQNEAYAVDGKTSDLYKINLSDYTIAQVGNTGVTMGIYYDSMDFDMDTDELFWTQVTDDTKHGFYKVNTTTGEATRIGDIGPDGALVLSLFMVPGTSKTGKTLYLYEYGDNFDNLVENAGRKGDVALIGRNFRKDGTWQSLWLPFDLTIEGSVLDGADVRTAESAYMMDKTLIIDCSTPVTKIEAGYPYLIKWDSGENILNPVFKDVTIKEKLTCTYPGFYGNKVVFYPNNRYKEYLPNDGYFSTYYVDGGSVLANYNTGYKDLAFNANFVVYDDELNAQIDGIALFFGNLGELMTDIREVKAQNGSDDVINEQGSTIVNLAGQRLQKLQKGINIVGSKKILVK